ncbi:DUF7537 family lipoprotein [Haloplanus aerogenes]|uniref:Uncharacterized protein n=1 Tax=Haloplanus aerogenes TaxID=660522 RepID=A0A3M0CWK2_9EURY|nr:hypothetical protein [Haloplanus aerogenes]AZH23877.1 hypothetical protein DU502_00145 [Haloplanus aerogenes]RMB13364.1 hypothetical protein ATH50_2697 [Haloplanus aerogenes]
MTPRRRVAAVVVGLLLVGAGCVAPTSQSAPPPGLDDDAVTDANALVRAHTTALESQSFTIHATTTSRPTDADYRVVTNRTWRVDPTGTIRGSVVSTSNAVGDAPARYARRPDERASWREGTTTYRRVDADGNATYRRVDLFNSSVKLSAAIQRQTLYRLNTRTAATVTPVLRDGARRYRIDAELNDTAVTTNASMTLLVDTNGIVRTMRTTRTVRYRSGTRVVTRTVRIEDVGNTTVERPDWYPAAVEATRMETDG